jgi:hypothetical protein
MDERRIFRACKPVRDACRLTAIPTLLNRKLLANVNSLFANESEFVLIGRHLD